MLTLPNWLPWCFLIGGLVVIGLSLLGQRNGLSSKGFVLGIIGIACALILWFAPFVTLK